MTLHPISLWISLYMRKILFSFLSVWPLLCNVAPWVQCIILGRHLDSNPESCYCEQYYRGPGFLAVVGFGLAPSPSPVSKLDRWHTERLRMRDNLLTGEGEGGGGGANHTTARKPVTLRYTKYSLVFEYWVLYWTCKLYVQETWIENFCTFKKYIFIFSISSSPVYECYQYTKNP